MGFRPRYGVGVLAMALSCAGPFAAQAGAGTWVAHNEGLRNLTVIGVGIAPSNPGVIYVQGRSLGIYKSTDGGATWAKKSSGIPDADPGLGHLLHDGPVVHPTDPNTVWAVSNGYIYKTTNGGTSWTQSSTGTTVNGVSAVRGAIVDPTNPNHLFAGTIVSGADGGVFESTNGGTNWTYIAGSAVAGSGIGNDAWPLALDASNTSRLYSGTPHESTYRCVDGGHTWINSPPVAGDHTSLEIAINPLVPSQIWTSVSGYFTYMSSDSAVTWSRRMEFGGAIAQICWAPSNAQVVYAILDSTIYRSDDNGATWSARASVAGGPRCMAVHPTDPQTLYVGTWGLGMYRSTDGGATFGEVNTGLPLTSLISGQHAFADPQVPGVTYCVLTGNCMYRKPTPTANWEYYSIAPGGYIQIDPQAPTRWFCVGGGFYRSTDSGLTWNAVYNPDGADVFGAWMDPFVEGHILIGDRSAKKIFVSTNGGTTWTLQCSTTSMPTYFNYFSDLSGDPYDNNVLLIAAYPTYSASDRQYGYIYRSGDGGATWAHIRDQMFYKHWRIGSGGWQIYNSVMQQWIKAYEYSEAIDNQTFGDGYYQCRIHVTGTENNDTTKWVGILVRMTSPDHTYTNSGWLVYLRKNGVVGLSNPADGTVINAAQVPIVADGGNWTTIRLDATGNSFELFVNGSSIGTYTDNHHRYDNAGYFGFCTSHASGEYDDLAVNAGQSYTDTFDLPATYGAYMGRWIAADIYRPGYFVLSSQGGGIWQSSDHGSTWKRITDASGEGLVNYRPVYSLLHAGNVYVGRGASYTWTVDNFYTYGAARQQLGQAMSYSSMNVSEDPFNLNRLYAALPYSGILVYEGTDVAGSPVMRMDFDHDGDVDEEDFGHIQACLSGANIPQTDPACSDALLDADSDVDISDVDLFQACFSGAGVVPPSQCWVYGP